MSKYRIMVVDDDPDIRFVVTNLLQADFETVQAENGLDALEKLDRYEPDLVLLDVQMPVMNGFAACRSIRREEAFASTPIFILTGNTDDETRRTAEEAGCADFIEKPFETTELIERIRNFFIKQRTTPRIKLFNMRELARIDATPLKPQHADDEAPIMHDETSRGSKVTAKLDARDVESRLEQPKEGRVKRVFGAKPTPPPAAPEAPKTPEKQPEIAKATPKAAPAPAPAPAAPKPQAPPPASPGKPRVMCLIESREELMAFTLALKGRAEFLPLEDAVEAVEIIARYQPDIVFMAVASAKYSGLQIAQMLRTNTRLSHIQPVFVISGREGEAPLRAAQSLTRTRFIPRPGTEEQIRRALDEITRQPDFNVREKNLPYGKYVDEVLKKQRGQREGLRKELEKEAFAAQHASLVPAFQDALKQFQNARPAPEPPVHTIK